PGQARACGGARKHDMHRRFDAELHVRRLLPGYEDAFLRHLGMAHLGALAPADERQTQEGQGALDHSAGCLHMAWGRGAYSARMGFPTCRRMESRFSRMSS